MGERAYIEIQSIKKLKKEEKEWALSPQGFKRAPMTNPSISRNCRKMTNGSITRTNRIPQKNSPALNHNLFPKYALYQKFIRDKQVERAQTMSDSGKAKKNRKNPNDRASFIAKMAVTKEGEDAGIKQYLDEDKLAEEA